MKPKLDFQWKDIAGDWANHKYSYKYHPIIASCSYREVDIFPEFRNL